MNQKEQNSNVLKNGNEFSFTSKSPQLPNSTYHCFNNSDISQSAFKHYGLNQDINDPGKYSNLQPTVINQKNSVMAFTFPGYEKALAARDYIIETSDSDPMNFQNNNYVLNNQLKNTEGKTKSASNSCLHKNPNFTNLCDRLNELSYLVDNARTRGKDKIYLLDQTINTFQTKIMNISDHFEDSLKQVSIENMRAKQELENLENKYSQNLISYQSNLMECSKEINNLKTENNLLWEKLNEEKKKKLSLSFNNENVFKEVDSENVLSDKIIRQNKVLNNNYEEILNENLILKDEINMIKNSLDEKKKQLDIQFTVIKEQTELKENLKLSDELNEELKKDNFSLKEQNQCLQKNNDILLEDINKIKLSQNEILKGKEQKFNYFYNHYNDLLKMQEESLISTKEQLRQQEEKECKIQAEVINLKNAVSELNTTKFNLQEELKTNHILIPELQNKIYDSNTNLANAYQKIRELDQKNILDINTLNKEKINWKNQSKAQLQKMKKLTDNCMNCKSKTKQLYVEFKKLNFQFSQSEQKKNSQLSSSSKIIEILSDENGNVEDDDCSIIKINNKDVSNMDISEPSTLIKMNAKYCSSNFKRKSSTLNISEVKKNKKSVEKMSSQKKS